MQMATKVFRGFEEHDIQGEAERTKPQLREEKMHSDGKRGNRHNLEHVKFQLHIIKKVYHEDG